MNDLPVTTPLLPPALALIICLKTAWSYHAERYAVYHVCVCAGVFLCANTEQRQVVIS